MGQIAMRPTVLIADADESIRDMVKRRLGDAATVVGEASDGKEAVYLAGELKPEVVLLDIGLPVIDGLAATHWIKAERPETRVILLTSHKEEAYLSATGKSGADAFLPKRQVRLGVLAIVRAAALGFTGGWDGQERRGRIADWSGGERRAAGSAASPRGPG
jgi:DNA-binding NarL/FixJ family response regulator